MRKYHVLAYLMVFLGAVPAAAQTPLQRIAFGSCADQERPQPIWDAVVATRPQLFLAIGDNIYADTQDMDVMRQKYAKQAAIPGFKKLLATCPVWAVWDDHDYGKNDAGLEYPKKKEAQQIFLEFFNEPKTSPRWQRAGLYDAKVFGPPDKSVQVILLDTRYFRSGLKRKAKQVPNEGPYEPAPDSDGTVLGEAQWKWLEEQLRVPARVRLLASSIQVVAEDHGWEKWMNLPRERERLFQTIKSTGAAGVVVLSGDRHLAELSLMDAGLGYRLYDLTSSGLNQGTRLWRNLEKNRHRVATMNRGDNFGLITIDWDPVDPLLSLQIRDDVGDIIIQHKIPLSILQPGALKSTVIPGAGVRFADGVAVSEQEIVNRLDKKVTIEMKVRATGAAKSGLVFLNSEADRGEHNFTVVLAAKAVQALKAAGVDDPRRAYENKTIRVTGTLTLFRERPQIVVTEASQIELAK